MLDTTNTAPRRIRLRGDGTKDGWNQDRAKAKRYLRPGEYAIRRILVTGNHAGVELEEVSGTWFNAVQFDEVA